MAAKRFLVLVVVFLIIGGAGFSCLHASRELTCKIKFKRKYDCSFKDIAVVENALTIGDQTILVGCGKRVTYNKTKEILAEDN
jgi:hypothetical protein